MSRRLRSIVLLPAALVLVLAGCGESEGESEEAKPYVDQMTKSLTEDEDTPFDEKQARCFSEGMIDVVGLDEFEKAGEPEAFGPDAESDALDFQKLEITRKQGEDIYANFEDCGVDMREEMLKSMEADEEMDETTKKCMDEALTDERLEDFFVTMMVEGEEALEGSDAGTELMQELMACAFANMDDLTTE